MPLWLRIDLPATLRIGNNRYAIANVQSFFRGDFVRHEPRDGIIRAVYLGHLRRAVSRIEGTGVRNLSAGLRVNHCTIENDFAFVRRPSVH